MMTVTLIPDVEDVNTVSSSASRYERQVYATFDFVGERNPRFVRFQQDTRPTCNVVRKVDLPKTHGQPARCCLCIVNTNRGRSDKHTYNRIPKPKETYVSNFVVLNKA